MAPERAGEPAPPPAVPIRGGRLFRKYVVVFLVLVGGVLMASSLVELYFSYRETQRAIVRVERAKAVGAAARIEQFLKEIEQQVRETTRTASDDPDASQVRQGSLGFREGLGAAMADQRELDFVRVLRNVPAISDLSHLDLSGKEQLHVSRLEPDVVGSQTDFSRAPKFAEARTGKTYWSPVHLRNGSEPYVTLAVPVGKYAVEVTTAEVSLRAIQRIISQVEVGPGGYAYVVDSRDHLVAHPDSRLLQANQNLSSLAQVKAARSATAGAPDEVGTTMVAEGLGGGKVLAAHAPIGALGWRVFVERPAADAYAPLRAPIVRSVVIFVLGLALSILASLLLARRMVAPIRELQEGATRIGAGKLDQPIELRTGDEIEGLAGSFNRMAASLKESYEGLERKVEARTQELGEANRDLTETLARQTATGEVLRAISRAQTDAQPVFDIIASSALRLCNAGYVSVALYDGELIHLAAIQNVNPAGVEALTRTFPLRVDDGNLAGRAIGRRAVVQIPDVLSDPAYNLKGPLLTMGFRSLLAVPLLRDGEPIGTVNLGRAEPGRFPDKQVELLQTFAAQAVIAIENVRLFTELEVRNRDLTEALEQQTATSEILRVLSGSPTDEQPVFEAIVESARRLCEATFSAVFLIKEGQVALAAIRGVGEEGIAAIGQAYPRPVGRDTTTGRSILDRRIIHIEDSWADPEYTHPLRDVIHLRSILTVPFFRDGAPTGAVSVWRGEARPFSDKQVVLLQTFADQAVIALENVRLFKELDARNRDLTEALEQQTATAEILRVISSSPTDVQPVFDAIAISAARLCEAFDAVVYRVEGDALQPVADQGSLVGPVPIVPGTVGGRSVIERQLFHIPDMRLIRDEFPSGAAIAEREGTRSFVSVPLMRAGDAIGTIGVRRFEVQPFSDKQITLLQTFADQAVIAIENVRLFKELQARTNELTQSVEELRALGEVGQVVSGTLDLQSVLTSIVSHAVELSRADAGTIYEFDEAEQVFEPRANYGMSDALIDALRQSHIRIGEAGIGQAAAARAAFQIPDLDGASSYPLTFLREEGFRAILAVPLLREDRVIGGLVVRRKVAGAFPKPLVDLLQTFATQSVIAIQNARLFREIDEKSRALEELSRNQEQLSRLSTALQEPLSLAEQLARVLDAARQVVGLDRLYIWTPSADGSGLMVNAQAGFGAEDWQDLVGVTIPVAEAGALAAVFRDGEPLLFTDAHPLPAEYRLRPPYSSLAGLRVKSYLVVPMIARGRTVGVLAADNQVTRAPIPVHTLDLLQTFAAQAAVAVENARLFQEIQEKGREVELASKHKSQFLANMSHELRTPMNAVLGYTDLILDDIFGEVPEPIRETLERVKTNGQHLLALINDVLDLSKMEAGQLTLSLGDYAMGEVVHAVVGQVESLAAGKKLALKAIVPPDLPPGRGDERRLTQVLLNLAGNAIKFTDQGEIVIEARATDDAFVVSVADTGPGISEADQQKIFEEFQQADSSSTRTKGGTGLGLSISRRIVELHGGRLWVGSTLGEGSTFSFTVPRRVERQAERA